ncbi:MAG: Spy/CpxP family protein refolding chaperone [Leptospiraceae bacterium]|nr:Spy/CpxP family protein refolding chaperone [Leptospiraceae bacterium]
MISNSNTNLVRKTSVALMAIGILGLLSLAACHPHPHGPGVFVLKVMDHMADDLDLTTAQQGQYQAIRARVESDMQQGRKGHLELLGQLEADFGSPNVEMSKVAEKIRQHQQRQNKLMAHGPDYLVEFYGILNPEQKKEFNTMVADHLQRIKRHID